MRSIYVSYSNEDPAIPELKTALAKLGIGAAETMEPASLFLVCFSGSAINEKELLTARNFLRANPRLDPWFVVVQLRPGALPPSVASLPRIVLCDSWEEGVKQIAALAAHDMKTPDSVYNVDVENAILCQNGKFTNDGTPGHYTVRAKTLVANGELVFEQGKNVTTRSDS